MFGRNYSSIAAAVKKWKRWRTLECSPTAFDQGKCFFCIEIRTILTIMNYWETFMPQRPKPVWCVLWVVALTQCRVESVRLSFGGRWLFFALSRFGGVEDGRAMTPRMIWLHLGEPRPAERPHDSYVLFVSSMVHRPRGFDGKMRGFYIACHTDKWKIHARHFGPSSMCFLSNVGSTNITSWLGEATRYPRQFETPHWSETSCVIAARAAAESLFTCAAWYRSFHFSVPG